MSNILHANLRYRTIDTCLQQTHRQWTWRELAAACGEVLRREIGSDLSDPSERTIKKDLAVMRTDLLGFSAPIVWDRRAKSYRYTKPGYSITKSPLTVHDLEELRHVLALLRQFRGFRQVAGLEGVVAKLELALRRDPQHPQTVIQFEPNWVADGLAWLNPLYDAITSSQCVQLTYQPFTEPAPYRRIVSPHLLKEYNNRWFLLAYDHHEQCIRTFALDRIHQAERYLLADYRRDPAFDADRYFHHLIGVSLPDDGAVETVRLRANAEQTNYLRTKPIHPSQSVESEDETGAVFTFSLIHNMELENLILSFGERVEVLAPAGLRARISERVGEMVRRYR